MPERKAFLAGLSICCLIGWSLLPWIQYGPLLQDLEFAAALVRATEAGFSDIASATTYPFSSMTRAESAPRFATFAETIDLGYLKQQCTFKDIAVLEMSLQTAILEGCRYGFFQGYSGGFVPHDPLSKAAAVVVVTRAIMPDKEFAVVKEFRVPYMQEAVRLGILHQPEHPYLMYPISRYELLLLLRRAYQVYQGTGGQGIVI